MHAAVPSRIVSLIVLAGLLGAPAFMHAEEPKSAPKPARDDPDRVICRRESVTGSLAQTTKICMKRSDWVKRSSATQDEVSDMQQRGLINSCGATEPGKC